MKAELESIHITLDSARFTAIARIEILGREATAKLHGSLLDVHFSDGQPAVASPAIAEPPTIAEQAPEEQAEQPELPVVPVVRLAKAKPMKRPKKSAKREAASAPEKPSDPANETWMDSMEAVLKLATGGLTTHELLDLVLIRRRGSNLQHKREERDAAYKLMYAAALYNVKQCHLKRREENGLPKWFLK